MPDLIKLYIRSGVIGLALAGVFVAMLMGLDVMHLRALVLGSDVGLVALTVLWLANAVVFGGVQFAISVMSMAQDDRPQGGVPLRAMQQLQPIPVEAKARRARYGQRESRS